MHMQSPYIFEIMLKLCQLYPDETASETTGIFIEAFIQRFVKITLDIAQNQTITTEGELGGQMAASSDQFSSSIKRLTPLEKEIFDLHRNQKLNISNWRRRQNHSVEFNYDLMDNDVKATVKRY